MKIKKRLYWDLMLRYVFFLLSTILVTGLFLGLLLNALVTTILNHPEVVKDFNIYIRNIEYDDRTKELKLPIDIGEDEWVEILKDNKVVYIKGNKQDDKMEYTQEELAQISNNVIEIITDNSFSYEYIPFKGLDGENYILLHKKSKFSSGVSKMKLEFPYSLQGSDFQQEIKNKVKFIFFIFLLLICIIIFLFSRITSKKIITPLKELNKGLKNVMNGSYDTKLDLKGSYEFQQIKDAFNYMTEKLQMAERENKAISESKKRLLLDISHDLRTPATTIQGYAQALYNDVVEREDDRKKYLSYIYKKSTVIVNLIETLFKYSRLESSVYDLNRQINDLSEFLRNVIISFYGELEGKGFQLDIKIPEKKILFNFDEVEMERAIANIIGNIIKYNHKNTMLLVHLMENNDTIQLVIGDNGIGIPDSIKENVFNALVRGDNARKTDGGTGLGLAISKKIIELHGGSISLESELGKGSKFIINFKK